MHRNGRRAALLLGRRRRRFPIRIGSDLGFVRLLGIGIRWGVARWLAVLRRLLIEQLLLLLSMMRPAWWRQLRRRACLRTALPRQQEPESPRQRFAASSRGKEPWPRESFPAWRPRIQTPSWPRASPWPHRLLPPLLVRRNRIHPQQVPRPRELLLPSHSKLAPSSPRMRSTLRRRN